MNKDNDDDYFVEIRMSEIVKKTNDAFWFGFIAGGLFITFMAWLWFGPNGPHLWKLFSDLL